MNSLDIADRDMVITASAPEAFTAVFTPKPDFPPFQGHFPDFKILPGVAQILLVTAAMRKRFGKEAELMEIQRVKFTNPALPEMQILIDVKLTGGEHNTCVAQAKLSGDGKAISTLKLLYGNVNIQ